MKTQSKLLLWTFAVFFTAYTADAQELSEGDTLRSGAKMTINGQIVDVCRVIVIDGVGEAVDGKKSVFGHFCFQWSLGPNTPIKHVANGRFTGWFEVPSGGGHNPQVTLMGVGSLQSDITRLTVPEMTGHLELRNEKTTHNCDQFVCKDAGDPLDEIKTSAPDDSGGTPPYVVAVLTTVDWGNQGGATVQVDYSP